VIGLVLSLALAAPFPLPAIDGKPPAVTANQKSFRLPIRFEKVKRFYVEQLGKQAEVTMKESSATGHRELTLSTKAKNESWTKAVVREGEMDTVIDVTPVVRLDEETISGNGKPLVEFIFGRSPDVDAAIKSIDHTEQMRSK
jgi:hypothetical protein